MQVPMLTLLRHQRRVKRNLFVMVIASCAGLFAYSSLCYLSTISTSRGFAEVNVKLQTRESHANQTAVFVQIKLISGDGSGSNHQTSEGRHAHIPRTDDTEHDRPNQVDTEPKSSSTETQSNADVAPRTESEFSYFLSTRRLVLLTVHKLNSMLEDYKPIFAIGGSTAVQFPCVSWWADPTRTIRHEIINSTVSTDEHLLEFEAETKWERALFRVSVQVNLSSSPNEIQIGTIQSMSTFHRRLRVNEEFSCLPNVTTLPDLNDTSRTLLESICSCEPKPNSGYDALFSWPVNVSFFPGDYLSNYKDLPSLFHVLPEPRHGAVVKHCGDSMQMLVMVSSAPKHFDQRQTIRLTYGSPENLQRNSARLVFLFGRVQDELLQNQLETEAKMHNDIVQANFIDGYHNLTLSHLSMYSYVYYVCSGKPQSLSLGIEDVHGFNPPKHVLKADDDFLLNLEIARKVAEVNPDVELIGCSYCGNPPIRNVTSMLKYYTPKHMYLGKAYPDYLSGVAYLLRSDIIPMFLRASLTTPFVHMDDAYMTGVLPHMLKVYPRHSRAFGFERIDPESICELRKTVASFVLGVGDMRKQWKAHKSVDPSVMCPDLELFDLKAYPFTKEFRQVCRHAPDAV